MFKASPKKMAAFMKIQENCMKLNLSRKSRKIVGKKLKKACQTRWLSFNEAVQSIKSQLPVVLQTLDFL